MPPGDRGPLAERRASSSPLEADSTPVITVLEILAERTGLNIVTSPEVQEHPISIRLKNTPFSEALNLVVRAAGLGYERVGNSILVADLRTLETQTGLTTRVFTLEYANASEVVIALDIFSEDVRSYISGNHIIVKAPQSIIEEIESIIVAVDRRPSQVMFEARLVEVNRTALKELGVDWDRITNWTTILVEGDPGESDTDQLPETLEFFKVGTGDAIYRQAAAVEVAVDLLITDGNAGSWPTPRSPPWTTSRRRSSSVKPFRWSSPPWRAVDGGDVLQHVAGVHRDRGQAQDHPAYLFGGIHHRRGDAGGEQHHRNHRRRPPHHLDPAGRVGGAGARRSEVLPGGLLNEASTETVSKVPILGDIPLIRYFFRHYRIETVQTDLLIEITPTIVQDQG